MYKILAFENGQPIILYLDKEKVYMYTASGGKIFSKGILFNDVGKDFDVFSCKEKYIYYISRDNQIKLAVLNRDHFTEFLSLPMHDKNHNIEIVHVSPLMCRNELYIFYCNHNKEAGKYEVYYILSSAPHKSCLIKRDIDTSCDFDVFKANEKIGIVLNDSYYQLDSNKKLLPIGSILQDGLHISSLANDIEELKTALSEKSNKLIEIQKQLFDKNNEISNLKITQKHISDQYNELSEYAGKLQDELRKIKYENR
jgi:hypothetical protein